MVEDYNALQGDYDSLIDEYDAIKGAYDSFKGIYDNLQGEYDDLFDEYNSIKGYESHLRELRNTRKIMYVTSATSVILLIVTIYLAMRKGVA